MDFTWKVFNKNCSIKISEEEIEYRRTFCSKTDLKQGCLPKCRICLDELSLNTILKKDVYSHPILEVLICRTCIRKFNDTNFAIECCFWCCSSKLFKTCVECTSHICLNCLQNNLSKDRYSDIVKMKNWICFICDPKPLWHYRAECSEIIDNNFTCKKKEIYNHIETSLNSNSTCLTTIVEESLNELSTFQIKIEQEDYSIDKAQKIVNFKMNIIKELIKSLHTHKGVLCDINELCSKYLNMPNEDEPVEKDDEKNMFENCINIDKKKKKTKLSLIEISSECTDDEFLVGNNHTTATNEQIHDTSDQDSQIDDEVVESSSIISNNLSDDIDSSMIVEPPTSGNSINYDSDSSDSSSKTVKVYYTTVNKNDNDKIMPAETDIGDLNTVEFNIMSLNNDKNSDLKDSISDEGSDKSFVFDIQSYYKSLKDTEEIVKEEKNICSEITDNIKIEDDNIIEIDDNPETVLEEPTFNTAIHDNNNSINCSDFHKLYFFHSLQLQHRDKNLRTYERQIKNALAFLDTEDDFEFFSDIDTDDDENMDIEDVDICNEKKVVSEKSTRITKQNNVADDIEQLNQLDNKYNLKECYVLLKKLEENPEPYYKDIKPKKVDDMKEIERLTDIENIVGKHKRETTTCNSKKKLKKRKRSKSIFSSTGSSDDTMDDNDNDSITSLEDLPKFSNTNLLEHENFEKDIINQITSNSSSEYESDDKSIGNEIKKSRKKVKRSKSTDSNKENTPVQEDNKNLKENKSNESNWKNDPLLRENLSDTETEPESDGEIIGDEIISDKIKKKIDMLIQNVIHRNELNPKTKDQPSHVPKIDNHRDKDLDETDTESDIEFISEVNKNNFKKSNNAICISSEEEKEESSLSQKKGRRNIRAILSDETLQKETKIANLMEKERIERLNEKEIKMSSVLSNLSQDEGLVLDIEENTNKPLIVVHSKLTKRLKSHQQDGVKFMWNNCFESVKHLQNGPGSGCILAHSMGLGKTFQVVALIHTLFAHKVTKIKHVLVVCPRSLVLNWEKEFKEGLQDLKEDDVKINVFYIGDRQSNPKLKLYMIEKWRQETGVLMIGYEAYQRLTKIKNPPELTHQEQNIKKTLVDPGPDLVVLDEGHLIKTGQSLRTKSLMNVKTKRRITLTGTPLQNNLKEYYYMVQFVKPNILGSYQEYTNRFVNPITNGQYDDSTVSDIIQMKRRSYVLHKLLRKTIQRYEVSELSRYLPEKFDYVLFIQLHPVQIELYKKHIESIGDSSSSQKRFLSDYYKLRCIWTHPYLLYLENQVKSVCRKNYVKKASNSNETPELNSTDNIQNIVNPVDWWQCICPEDYKTNIEYGPKFKIMLSIIHMCEGFGDKVLIFCNSLAELDAIEFFLQQQSTDISRWKAEEDYYRLDGSLSPETRHQLCESFNNKSNKQTRVFLISHRVGGLGLNLVAANRVILMNVNFNPASDNQSLFRAYRFGQEKCCYVYRLVSMGTMEEVVYERQVTKLATFGRVIDDFQISRHYKSHDLQEMYRAKFNTKETPQLPLPNDVLLAKLIHTNAEIFKYHEHQALLENLPEEELNEYEMKQAWLEFHKEDDIKNQAVAVQKQELQKQELPGPSGINVLPNNHVAIVQPNSTPRNITNTTLCRTSIPNNISMTNKEKPIVRNITVRNNVIGNAIVPYGKLNLNGVQNMVSTSNNLSNINPTNNIVARNYNNQMHLAKSFTISQGAHSNASSLPIGIDENTNRIITYNKNKRYLEYLPSHSKQTVPNKKEISNNMNTSFRPTNRISATNPTSNTVMGTPTNTLLGKQLKSNYNTVRWVSERNNMEKNQWSLKEINNSLNRDESSSTRMVERPLNVNYSRAIPNNNNAPYLTENNGISDNLERTTANHSNQGAIIEID